MPEAGTFVTAGIWTVALGIVTLIIRQIGPWRKQITETEERLRAELSTALSNERASHRAELAANAAERAEMCERLAKMERTLSRQQASHTAERALDRHKFTNITACFDAMLLLLEMNPEKGPEIVAKIKAMRAAQMRAEAEEKAIIRAAVILADEEDEQAKGEDK